MRINVSFIFSFSQGVLLFGACVSGPFTLEAVGQIAFTSSGLAPDNPCRNFSTKPTDDNNSLKLPHSMGLHAQGSTPLPDDPTTNLISRNLIQGTFHIVNVDSSRFISTDPNGIPPKSGGAVKTVPKAPPSCLDAVRFTVTAVDGLYSFLSVVGNRYISPGNEPTSGKPALVWRIAPHYWNVISVSPGVWEYV
jgi:hypothetical protein